MFAKFEKYKTKKSSFLLKKNKIENEIKIEKKNNFSYSKLGCFTRMVENLYRVS